MPRSLSPREQLALIFEAGLSTAKEVTSISGRGVGMDVVRSNIERIGGIVEVDSKLGEGTRMTLRVPLTLTIIPALTVSIAGQHFAIPRSAIEEIVRANGESVTLEHLGGAGVATIRGRRVPEVSLAEILGLHSDVEQKDQTLIVLRPAGGDVYALSVDRIHDHEELVVKPAAPAVMATGLYAGTTLADDGSPILLFDPAGLAEVGGVKLEMQERTARIAQGPAEAVSKATAVLLFRGLDGGRRALRLAVVDRIEEVPASSVKQAAGQIRVQVGEAILPLAGVSAGRARGRAKSACSASTTASTRWVTPSPKSSTSPRSTMTSSTPRTPGEISGVSLINGEPAELVDAHWLFANHVGAAARATEAAGLPPAERRSVDAEHASPDRRGCGLLASSATRMKATADLVIASQGETVDASQCAIYLRSEPEPRNKKDESIYRYDRAGLLMALKSAGAGRGK